MSEMTYASDIERAERELEEVQRAYLKRWGWQMTCHNPGSYWLWHRDWTPDDEAALARWHERNALREQGVKDIGHACTPNGPNPPKPYGVACVPMETAIGMTLRSLDTREEDGPCDD